MMSRFEKVGSSVAINKTASLVASKGFEYTPDKKILTMDSDFPINTIPVPSCIDDLTRFRSGRVVVVGFYDRRPKKTNRWVVKCDCGTYSVRKGQTLRRGGKAPDCCEKCKHGMYLKRSAEYQAYGKNSKEY